MIVALIVLAVLNIAQALINYGLLNRLLLQARIPTLGPVPVQQKQEEVKLPERKPMFRMPIVE